MSVTASREHRMERGTWKLDFIAKSALCWMRCKAALPRSLDTQRKPSLPRPPRKHCVGLCFKSIETELLFWLYNALWQEMEGKILKTASFLDKKKETTDYLCGPAVTSSIPVTYTQEREFEVHHSTSPWHLDGLFALQVLKAQQSLRGPGRTILWRRSCSFQFPLLSCIDKVTSLICLPPPELGHEEHLPMLLAVSSDLFWISSSLWKGKTGAVSQHCLHVPISITWEGAKLEQIQVK